jgi:hypothetical protein
MIDDIVNEYPEISDMVLWIPRSVFDAFEAIFKAPCDDELENHLIDMCVTSDEVDNLSSSVVALPPLKPLDTTMFHRTLEYEHQQNIQFEELLSRLVSEGPMMIDS